MILLDSRQLRAFQELAKRESFTEAAQHLHLTQSAVSHSIKALESSLDVNLFTRMGKKIQLTHEGETLLPHANAILRRMEEAVQEVVHQRQPGCSRLRIGAPPSISQFVLPEVLRQLLETFPNHDISVSTDNKFDLITKLESAELDFVVALESNSHPKLNFSPLFVDTIEMAITPSHPFASKDTITQKDISSQKFIIRSKESDTYHIVDSQFPKNKHLPLPIEAGSTAAIKEMSKIGLGVGLLAPWVALDEVEAGSLLLRPFPKNRPQRTWGLYTKNHSENDLMTVFTDLCRKEFASLGQ